MVKNMLTLVNVDTASGSKGPGPGAGHELTLKGLVDPHQFKKDVWAMKRGEGINGSVPTAPPSSGIAMDRSGGVGFGGVEMSFGKSAALASNSDVVPLMMEQNKLLKEQNSILQKILAK